MKPMPSNATARQHFAEAFKAARKAAKLSGTGLCARIKKPQNYIWRVEAGQFVPTGDVMIEILSNLDARGKKYTTLVEAWLAIEDKRRVRSDL